MTHFIDAFIRIARQYPDNIAIDDHGRTLTYRELLRRVCATGEKLKSTGTGHETPVAIAMEKSADYIVALLGIWYAGGAFVPLPPSLPDARRDIIRQDAGITRDVTPADTQETTDVCEPVAVHDETLAYIIYTSGSTGRPKGVMVEHRGIMNFLMPQIVAFDIAAGDRNLFYLSVNFDAALSDIGVTLLTGATLVIDERGVQTPGITHADIPPSLLKAFAPEGLPDTLKTIIIGGEACDPDTVRRHGRSRRVVNVYGPTETTVCTSLNICDPDTWDKPLVGAPFDGVTFKIIDDELHIGGLQLARGYVNLPALTAEKFVTIDGDRYYRSGDRVRSTKDGIEFIARIDRQFKLRGQLVEPEEIETCLQRHAGVTRAAAFKKNDRLVACIEGHTDENILRRHVQQHLPAWMVPQDIMILDRFPLTASGKTDYTALATIGIPATTSYTAPRTAKEKQLWQIWRDVLGHNNFGVTDDFHAVGGDSIGVIKLTLAAEKHGISISPAAFVRHRTIAEQAEHAETTSGFLDTGFIRRDVAFDAGWHALFTQAPQTGNPNSHARVLLTGATGFLGSHVLAEILAQTSADIYCIVRAGSDTAAMARIKAAFGKFKLPAPDWSRIHAFAGDLAAGIPDTYAEMIDTVYHCAARVNIIDSYDDLRRDNVVTTQNVLRFCLTGARKTLHYASTLSVFVATDQNTGTLREDDRLENVTKVYGGYAQTKYASEWLLLQAPKAAADILSYRFGLVTANSRTGAMSDHDFLQTFSRGISDTGYVPEGFDDKIFVDITPVDFAAQAMVTAALRGTADIYHIAGKKPASLGDLLKPLPKVKKMPVAQLRQYIAEKPVTADETTAALALCRCVPEIFETQRHIDLFQATGVVFDTRNVDALGLTCAGAENNLIARYMTVTRPLRICLFGPESTGKSTLAAKLATHYDCGHVIEYAKTHIENNNGDIGESDIPEIARGQINAARQAAGDMVIHDTDLTTTVIWSKWLFGSCPAWIEQAAAAEHFDLYLLMDIDTPWVADIHRYLPDDRANFLNVCRTALEDKGASYIMLSGGWNDKFHAATGAIDALIAGKIRKTGT
jgi:amino acid adenylation domain-containing protein/thioester reductase-like protein